MNQQDIRWQQQFQNFEKAIHYLEDALKIYEPDLTQKAGMIQFFEMCFELAWNTVKDYSESRGFGDIKSPRAALKKGFEMGLIADGHGWMELMEDRNLTAHTYDEKVINEIEHLIRHKYYPLIKQLEVSLKQLAKG